MWTAPGLGSNIDPQQQFHLEEMADSKLRGTLSACILLTYSAGIMLISLIGTNVSWPIAAGVGAAITFVDLVGYSYSLLHESPVWLVRNNHIDKANEVFRWGPNHQVEVDTDLQELLKRIKDEEREHTNQMNTSLAFSQKWNQYLRPQAYKPFIIIYIFNIMQIVCGTDLFIFYFVDIISGFKSDGSLDINLTTILTSTVKRCIHGCLLCNVSVVWTSNSLYFFRSWFRC